ncbi:hypothetical protein JVT61DRAFT_6981 [Boletus reticuloceps]|uniref:Uncharacterized protein n=1 Tax=Boletus reticuloceps TaxID=495285 RepID=A0A8I2YKK9_9AGAM|nr:hypothetical protein JVT61DRAFT_6981 [Boletus reticuloceps]
MIPSTHNSQSSELVISQIHHLQLLLENLPPTLPLDPEESNYHFGLDAELINEEGLWYAFNRNLEVCFETHKLGSGGKIIFQERGNQYKGLIEMIKATIMALPTEGERTFLRDVWIEHLITAAELQGAKVLAKCGLHWTQNEVFTWINAGPCGKRARTLLHKPSEPGSKGRGHSLALESETDTDSESKSDSEIELVDMRPQKPLQKRVSIHLAANIQPGLPKGWKSGVPWQLTFHDLNWKPLDMEEAKELQRKWLAEFDKESWRDVVLEEERDKACRKACQDELAAKRQRALTADKVQDHRTKQECHQCTNWYQPFLWVHIDHAAKRHHWSPQAMVCALKNEHLTLFSHLHKGTVFRWIDKSKQRWSAATLLNVQNGHTIAGSGQSGILSHYPQVQEEIITKLKNLRASGLPINVVILRSIMLAVIQNHIPELLKTFKCSEKFVRSFFDSVLGWSPHKGTPAVAKLPANAEHKCEEDSFTSSIL